MKPPGERATTTERIRRAGRLHVDVGSSLDLVGTITKYLAAAPLIPAALAVG